MDYDAAIARAEALAVRRKAQAELLFFHRAVLRFQRDVQHRLRSKPRLDPQKLDTSMLTSFLPDYLQLVEKYGPKDLMRQARQFEDRQDWEEVVRTCWQQGRDRLEVIVRAVLQPYVRHLSERWRVEVGGLGDGTGACPFCSRAPIVSVMDGKLLLVCSLCDHEWGFPEDACPACRSERLESVRHRSMPHVRAVACRDCRRYLKRVDLKREPQSVPRVEELASTELDRLARGKGYEKLERNIAGL
jgi:formate dehydrogenase maturation protein FdhE